jgi:hypothetical protein
MTMAPINQSSMTPEQMMQWMKLSQMMGPLGDQERDIDRQQKYADELRRTKGPEGRQTGRLFTAAKPIEHLAGLANQAAGIYAGKALEGQRSGVTEGISGAMSDATKDAIRSRARDTSQAWTGPTFPMDATPPAPAERTAAAPNMMRLANNNAPRPGDPDVRTANFLKMVNAPAPGELDPRTFNWATMFG